MNRAAFEAFFRWSRNGKGANYADDHLTRIGDEYVAESTQRHWWTWQHAWQAATEVPMPRDPYTGHAVTTDEAPKWQQTALMNAEQGRFHVTTKAFEQSIVQIVEATFEGQRRDVSRRLMKLTEEHVRAALIKLGWTPPPTEESK